MYVLLHDLASYRTACTATGLDELCHYLWPPFLVVVLPPLCPTLFKGNTVQSGFSVTILGTPSVPRTLEISAVTVCLKKNAANALQRHLKTWRHMCRFLFHRACYTSTADGCTAVHCLVNPRVSAPFENVVHPLNRGTVCKKHSDNVFWHSVYKFRGKPWKCGASSREADHKDTFFHSFWSTLHVHVQHRCGTQVWSTAAVGSWIWTVHVNAWASSLTINNQ